MTAKEFWDAVDHQLMTILDANDLLSDHFEEKENGQTSIRGEADRDA